MDPSLLPRLRQLKKAFDEAYQKGMEGLFVGDSDQLTAAIEQERLIIIEQDRLLNDRRGIVAPGPRPVPPMGAKAVKGTSRRRKK